jgi:hypothetical protein
MSPSRQPAVAQLCPTAALARQVPLTHAAPMTHSSHELLEHGELTAMRAAHIPLPLQ